MKKKEGICTGCSIQDKLDLESNSDFTVLFSTLA